MPNYCDFEMKIKGTKENRDKLVSYLQADYEYDMENKLISCTADKHFNRVFEANIIDEGNDCTYMQGYCAWSTYVCMFDGETTFYKDFNHEGRLHTNLETETKNLDLTVEIHSAESGVGFIEHYIIDKGVIQKNECYDYSFGFEEDELEMISNWDFEI